MVNDGELDPPEAKVEATFPEADAAVWSVWARDRSSTVRDEIVQQYLPLARSIAGRVYRMRSSGSVQFDDYLQYARLGLIEAVERFDPGRGVPFPAFAQHRIRGAVLSGLTRESELAAQREASRRIAGERRESLLADARDRIEKATLDDLIGLTVGLALGALLEGDGAGELPDDSPQANPYAATEALQLSRMARSAVDRLPDRERDLIRAHYFEHREFREIAEDWGVSPGRVSQLHGRAIGLLRKALAAEPRLNRQI